MGDLLATVQEPALLCNYLVVGMLLFAIGLIGFLVRRNLIIMFLCAEMMLQGVSLSFIAWGRYHDHWGGQMMVLFIIAVAACEAAVALALIVCLYHRSGTLDAAFWQDLREEGQPAFVDREVPEALAEDQVWPTLPAAGVQPELDLEELTHRSRI